MTIRGVIKIKHICQFPEKIYLVRKYENRKSMFEIAYLQSLVSLQPTVLIYPWFEVSILLLTIQTCITIFIKRLDFYFKQCYYENIRFLFGYFCVFSATMYSNFFYFQQFQNSFRGQIKTSQVKENWYFHKPLFAVYRAWQSELQSISLIFLLL